MLLSTCPLQLEQAFFRSFLLRASHLCIMFLATHTRSMNIPNEAIPNSIATRLNVWDWYINVTQGGFLKRHTCAYGIFFLAHGTGSGLVVIHAVSLAIFGTLAASYNSVETCMSVTKLHSTPSQR